MNTLSVEQALKHAKCKEVIHNIMNGMIQHHFLGLWFNIDPYDTSESVDHSLSELLNLDKAELVQILRNRGVNGKSKYKNLLNVLCAATHSELTLQKNTLEGIVWCRVVRAGHEDSFTPADVLNSTSEYMEKLRAHRLYLKSKDKVSIAGLVNKNITINVPTNSLKKTLNFKKSSEIGAILDSDHLIFQRAPEKNGRPSASYIRVHKAANQGNLLRQFSREFIDAILKELGVNIKSFLKVIKYRYAQEYKEFTSVTQLTAQQTAALQQKGSLSFTALQNVSSYLRYVVGSPVLASVKKVKALTNDFATKQTFSPIIELKEACVGGDVITDKLQYWTVSVTEQTEKHFRMCIAAGGDAPKPTEWGELGSGLAFLGGGDGGGDSLKYALTILMSPDNRSEKAERIFNRLYHVGSAQELVHVNKPKKGDIKNVSFNRPMHEDWVLLSKYMLPEINEGLTKLMQQHIHILEWADGAEQTAKRYWDFAILPTEVLNTTDFLSVRDIDLRALRSFEQEHNEYHDMTLRTIKPIFIQNCDLKFHMKCQTQARENMDATCCPFCDWHKNDIDTFDKAHGRNKDDHKGPECPCTYPIDPIHKSNFTTLTNNEILIADNTPRGFNYRKASFSPDKGIETNSSKGKLLQDLHVLMPSIGMDARCISQLHLELGITGNLYKHNIDFTTEIGVVTSQDQQFKAESIKHLEDSIAELEGEVGEGEGGSAEFSIDLMETKPRMENARRLQSLITKGHQNRLTAIEAEEETQLRELLSEFIQPNGGLDWRRMKELHSQEEPEAETEQMAPLAKSGDLETKKRKRDQDEQLLQLLHSEFARDATHARLKPCLAEVLGVFKKYGIDAKSQWGGTIVGYQTQKLTETARKIFAELKPIWLRNVKVYFTSQGPQKVQELTDRVNKYCTVMVELYEQLHIAFGLLNSKDAVSDAQLIDLENYVLPRIDVLWREVYPLLSKKKPKLHVLLVHSADFIRYFGRRLGLLSEQGIERLHNIDNKLNARVPNQKNFQQRESIKHRFPNLRDHPLVCMECLKHDENRSRHRKDPVAVAAMPE